MVNNQTEFNEQFFKEVKEIEIEYDDFEGQLVIENYPELEKLYLRDIESIDKLILKNLPQLRECTVWGCGLAGLVIENCPQIKKFNLRSNKLDNLEFLKDLNELESLELDNNVEVSFGLRYLPSNLENFSYVNTKLAEILEPLESSWKNCKNEILIDSLEVSHQKYNNLKIFLKGILSSLSKETQKELVDKLDKEIKGEIESFSSVNTVTKELKTTELMFNVKEVIESAKELREKLKTELEKSESKIQVLERELAEAGVRTEERIKRLNQQEQNLEAFTQTPIYEKTLDFLRAKSTFLNARYKTIEELKKCFIMLENKYGKSDRIGELGNAIGNVGGPVPESITFGIPKAVGEAIVAGSGFSKIRILEKSNKEFQILLESQEELSQLNDAYNSLFELVRKNGESINILNLKDRLSTRTGKARFFNINYETFDVLNEEGIWKNRTLTPERMETVIISLSSNFKKLESEWEEEFEKLKSNLGEEGAIIFIQEQQTKVRISQLQIQLGELIDSVKDKLKSDYPWPAEREKRNKERKELLQTLLNSQEKIVHLEKIIIGGEVISNQNWVLRNAKQKLLDSKKITENELDSLCQIKTELTRLQIKLENLQHYQSQQEQHLLKEFV